MRTRPQLARVLVLIGLFTILAAAPGLAATAPAAPLPAPSISQAAPVADFLATLAAEPAGNPASTPATDCRSSARSCPAPKLCCLACGYFGCDTYACFDPVNGHCPLFP
ncbi:MAG TPA: hypothetical protein VIA62_06305 [Thermoanaerobaculia bacterium]|jgi:hypothetical protein|nr:hypothetical protein [Thermoanaerobaculia bacterium]